jgi:hypothetical protein
VSDKVSHPYKTKGKIIVLKKKFLLDENNCKKLFQSLLQNDFLALNMKVEHVFWPGSSAYCRCGCGCAEMFCSSISFSSQLESLPLSLMV